MSTPQTPQPRAWQKTVRTEWPSTAGIPEWLFALPGQYADDPIRLQIAITRYLTPHTTEKERAAVAVFTLAPAYPCASCGRHRFPKPGATCYWCRRLRCIECGAPAAERLCTRCYVDSKT